MKLENQVCSLELAKKLKGVKQDSHFVWFDMDGDWQVVEKLPAMPPQNGANEWYSAFTVAELGEMLPENFNTLKSEGKWYCLANEYSGFCSDEEIEQFEEESETEADARAAMLVHLLENKLITL